MRYQQNERRQPNWVLLIALLALILPSITVWHWVRLWRIHADNERIAPLVQCAGHLRAIGVAMQSYLDANKNTYPPTLAQLSPYLSQANVMECPGASRSRSSKAPSLAAGTCDYLYWVGEVHGPLPPNAIVACDRRDNHKGQLFINVLLANGEVERVTDASTIDRIVKRRSPTSQPVLLPR